jgi:hypothetical protein
MSRFMSDWKNSLLHFATQKAPATLFRLPSTWPTLAAPVAGTNTEFLLRYLHEGRDVLDRGDSQLTAFRFTYGDLNSVYHAFQICCLLIREKDIPVENPQELLAPVPEALLRIATYYEDKEIALGAALEGAKEELPELQASIADMFVRRDYKSLLALYDHFAGLVDLDDEIIAAPTGTVSFCERRRDHRVLEAFKEAVDEAAGGGFGRRGWLGATTRERDLEEEIGLCRVNMERNRPILDGVRFFANDMAIALGQAPVYKAKLLPFPGRALV